MLQEEGGGGGGGKGRRITTMLERGWMEEEEVRGWRKLSVKRRTRGIKAK